MSFIIHLSKNENKNKIKNKASIQSSTKHPINKQKTMNPENMISLGCSIWKSNNLGFINSSQD